MRRLLLANAVLALLLGAHLADHMLRQHAPVPATLAVPGAAGVVAVLASLGLAAARRPVAWPAAALVGAATALGFLLIHVVPDWGPVSDSYLDHPRDAVSWASMLAALAGGVVLAAVAAAARPAALRPPAPGTGSSSRAVRSAARP